MATYKTTIRAKKTDTATTVLFDGNTFTAQDTTTITTTGGIGIIRVADGNNTYNINSVKDAQTFLGGKGNDSFVINANKLTGVTINGGVSDKLAYNGSLGAFTALAADAANKVYAYTGDLSSQAAVFSDAAVMVAGRPGATGSFNQTTSKLVESSLNDGITFARSGDFSTGLAFTNIEKLILRSGVQITLSSAQLKANFDSLDKGTINPGMQFIGVAGGREEVVHIQMWSDTNIADDDGDDGPVGVIDPAVGRSYNSADMQLDDFTIGNILQNVTLFYQGRNGTGLLPNSYIRVDGCNNGERGNGAEGPDNATMRLGDDTYYGYGGNDLLVGHGGKDQLFGGSGNDLFTVGSFGSGTPGTTSKSDDGEKEWIATGGSKKTDHDFIDGGTGVDTLRITAGIGAVDATTGKLELLDSNIVNVERVEVGATISKDPDESQFQFQADEHWYLNKGSKVSDTAASVGGKYLDANNNGSFDTGEVLNSLDFVVVDASRVTKKGLTFEGNANNQTFIGTSQADVFIGNGGTDRLTGNGGADQFVFQTVRTYARDNATANNVISYTNTDTALTATDADTITDFVSGTDKFVFRVEGTTALEDSFDSLVALRGLALTTANVLISDIAAGTIDSAGTADSFIKADTTGNDINIYYDADGSGATGAVLIATLLNASTIALSDFVVAPVINF